MFYHRTWQLLASQARLFPSSADRFQYLPCDDRVDKIRVDSTWQHVHMQTCCMWDQGTEVDLLVHTKSRQSCACHRTAKSCKPDPFHPAALIAFSVFIIVYLDKQQTHTAALHSRFTNCATNTRVLTRQGSWIEIVQAFSSAAGGSSEMSVCFPPSYKAA